eukprot:CAMPEP_0182449558 /NCGR_PEP_ID=MMETSP1172-20130603/35249_1 /TAXON_ID=708627 /ORGANISM="Timspurckia oligopyrenoides, Strain CCMP3278" /LENGTH=67 /DNA_ID=CAMNT_0024646879 /DNA_START=71 /DNA_END=274 /DNA_ORIENTATION=+
MRIARLISSELAAAFAVGTEFEATAAFKAARAADDAFKTRNRASATSSSSSTLMLNPPNPYCKYIGA